ncbi:HAMP domain-containing histidine kinase [Paenibacillus sp. LHD-117]|uniref:HAMP domain-containing sensor histidine kinase n=1 Tax=Paenibacillus sp. LHD-117 TaxID=3071412 RepID=UPI0027E17632|nr:HAMP domain-containing histidine kinase [Paenibacillus sp. LHD-117]MDQ6423241.1 HAMP domain-containing histidine kinase [Paenibacillus sp. LHD-117]
MSLKKWTGFYFRLPIKIKLTLGSTLLIMALFVGYNLLQYIVMEQWIIQREKKNIRHDMNAILNDLLEREAEFKSDSLADIKQYLDKMNSDDQRIRVLDADHRALITVTDNVTDPWMDPLPIPQQEIGIYKKDGHSLLIMKSPLTIHRFTGTVEIVKSLAQFEALTKTISQVMFYFAIGAVALSVLVGWLLTRRLLRPLQAMAQTIRDVNNKGMQERMRPAMNGDEISTLMVMFNDMMDRVEETFLQQSRFVEDASHELRTPVAIIEGHLAMLRRWGKDDPVVLNESLDASLEEFARLKRLVMELLALSRAEKEARDEVSPLTNVPDAVASIIERFAFIHPDFRIEFDLHRLKGISLMIPIGHLEQILLILLDNATKYSVENKTIVIKADVAGERADIEVIDCGIGIPAQDLPYVTDRFYRVDRARSREQGGNGLGLAIAKRLAERYDGTLAIRSEELAGTVVTVRLPCLPRE